jgi:uracil-DNA glycosylase family protein
MRRIRHANRPSVVNPTYPRRYYEGSTRSFPSCKAQTAGPSLRSGYKLQCHNFLPEHRIVSAMQRKTQPASSAAEYIPPRATLAQLRDLWLRGAQTVFGAGARHATVMFVGEQPGDKEDLEGKPFVGPAGAVLDKALVEAGIDRKQTYVTNAVKHFKWEPRGKRRIHKKPNSIEISACRAWLDAEIDVLKPQIIVCLGATAAQSLLGRTFRVTQQRGKLLPFRDGVTITATVHPSSILRAPDEESRHREMQLFIDDLQVISKFMKADNDA